MIEMSCVFHPFRTLSSDYYLDGWLSADK